MTAKLVGVDYAVMVVMMLISCAVGAYYCLIKKKVTLEEFFVASRSMNVTIVAVSLMTSYLSAVSLLGVSSENYVYGTQYAVINVAYGLATPVVVYFYLPVFFRLGATSAFEYLEKRYGMATRLVASSAFLFQLLLYTGVVLYAPALALEATTGMSRTINIVALGLACIFYTAVGGMRAVLVTDVLQSIVMLLAVLTVIVTGVVRVGSFARLWEIADKGSRLEFDNFSLDPTVRHTWWSLTFGGFFTYLSLFGVNQVQVQRMLTVKNVEAAKRAIWWSWPMASIMSLATCLSGLAIYAKYRDCDPVAAGRIESSDQLMPLYVMDTLSEYPGVPGLFIAGIFSAGLSTISATVSSLAAVIVEDYIKPWYRARGKEHSRRTLIRLSRCLTVLVGLCCLGVAFLTSYLGGLLQSALTIFGVIGGPMLGLFTLGMFSETGNQRGGITGLLIGLLFCLWLGFGQPKPPIPHLSVSTDGCGKDDLVFNQTSAVVVEFADNVRDESYFYLYRISYMWYCPIGFLVTLVVGWIASWLFDAIFKGKREELDPNLFTPILASIIRKRRDPANEFHSTIILDKFS